MVLAQTVKGYALGPNFEGRNATHQMKKMTPEQLRIFRDILGLSGQRCRTRRRLPPYLPLPAGSAELDVPARAPSRAGRVAPSSPRDPRCPSGAAGSGCVRRLRRRLGQARGVHDGRLHPAAALADARSGHRWAGGADRAGRGPHLRLRGALQRIRHLRPRRAAVHPRRCRACSCPTRRPRPDRCCRRGSPRPVGSPS